MVRLGSAGKGEAFATCAGMRMLGIEGTGGRIGPGMAAKGAMNPACAARARLVELIAPEVDAIEGSFVG